MMAQGHTVSFVAQWRFKPWSPSHSPELQPLHHTGCHLTCLKLVVQFLFFIVVVFLASLESLSYGTHPMDLRLCLLRDGQNLFLVLFWQFPCTILMDKERQNDTNMQWHINIKYSLAVPCGSYNICAVAVVLCPCQLPWPGRQPKHLAGCLLTPDMNLCQISEERRIQLPMQCY